MSAPHLPPKTNNLKWHERWLFIRLIFFILLIALAAGAAAALVVLAWYPALIGIGMDQRPVITPVVTLRPSPSPDAAALARTIEQVTMYVYRASDRVRVGGIELYPTQNAVGRGVLLTADGWFLTTSAVAQASTDLRVVDSRGTAYRIEKQTRDPVTGLSFVKVAGASLSAVPIANRAAPKPGAVVYSGIGAAVHPHVIGPAFYNQREPLTSDQLTRLFSLVDADAIVSEGAPLFTGDGLLLGIAHRTVQGMVIVPVVAVRQLFDVVFGGNAITPQNVRISYVFMPDVMPSALANDLQAPRVGAYVIGITRHPRYRGTLPSIAQGDIITAVNDEPITQHETLTLLMTRLRPAKEAVLTVYRNGEHIRVPVTLSSS